jgi:hypothetical protein
MAYVVPEVPTKYFHDLVATIPSLSGKVIAITGTTSGMLLSGLIRNSVAIERPEPAAFCSQARASSLRSWQQKRVRTYFF